MKSAANRTSHLAHAIELLWGLPEAKGVDLDSPQALDVHRRIIQQKPFLKQVYRDHYRVFIKTAEELRNRPGKLVELGSGGGFLKEVLPDVITSDVCAGPGIDCVIRGDQMPFDTASVKALFLLNVLHHIPKPELLFQEARRCLVHSGRIVMIEPYNSWLGRILYKKFHHEPFDETVQSWDLPTSGRMTASNQAIPWIIFFRDRDRFQQRFPELQIRETTPHTALGYVLSGGMSFRAFVPRWSYPLTRRVDQALSVFQSCFPTLFTIVLERK